MKKRIKTLVQNRYNNTSKNKSKKYTSPIYDYYYRKVFVDEVADYINSSIEKNTKILDIGTGAGLYPHHMSNEGFDVYGIDISNSALKTAQQNANNGNTSYLLADGESLCFKNNSFRGIIAIGTFEYVLDLEPFLDEIARVSTPGAQFVFSVHNEDSYSSLDRTSPVPTARYSISEIREILSKEGFVLESYHTTHFVSDLQKLMFQSKRVPDLARWLTVMITTKVNNICSNLPFINKKGETIIVSSKYVSSE